MKKIVIGLLTGLALIAVSSCDLIFSILEEESTSETSKVESSTIAETSESSVITSEYSSETSTTTIPPQSEGSYSFSGMWI